MGMFFPENIPPEMKESKQWVLYVKEKVPGSEHLRKQMVSIEGDRWHLAKSTNPNDWSTFEKAYQTLQKSRYDGLCYCLDKGLVFLDLDNSIDDNGGFSPLAEYLLSTFPDTYSERSCSGRGIHIFLRAKMPPDSMKRNDRLGIECYEERRFCCMTGDILSATKEIKDYSKEFAHVAERLLKRKEPERRIYAPTPLSLSDQENLEKAFRSKVGPRIQLLYSGDWSGYPSRSNADLALVNHLAFYTQDPKQLDSLFRNSGLYREKWDQKRGELTYGEMTIERALSGCRNTYKGRQSQSER